MWHGHLNMGKIYLIYKVLWPSEPYCTFSSAAWLNCVGNQVSLSAWQSQDSWPVSRSNMNQGGKGGEQDEELLFNYLNIKLFHMKTARFSSLWLGPHFSVNVIRSPALEELWESPDFSKCPGKAYESKAGYHFQKGHHHKRLTIQLLQGNLV